MYPEILDQSTDTLQGVEMQKGKTLCPHTTNVNIPLLKALITKLWIHFIGGTPQINMVDQDQYWRSSFQYTILGGIFITYQEHCSPPNSMTALSHMILYLWPLKTNEILLFSPLSQCHLYHSDLSVQAISITAKLCTMGICYVILSTAPSLERRVESIMVVLFIASA